MKDSPDKVHGPLIAMALKRLCQMIREESGASGVRAEATYLYKNGKGELKLSTYVTPDSSVERLMDGERSPRGTKLAHDAALKLKFNMLKLKRGK